MSGNRLEWVDLAKGLSIILVVMLHSAYGVGEETGGSGVLHYVIGWATPFRMPEFFLISGLFLGQVIDRDWRRYADRRVVHYLYFYALWAVLQIIFKTLVWSRDPLLASSQIAWSVVEPYGVLWFIYMLAAFCLVTKLLWQFRINHWIVLAVGAALQIAPIHVGSELIDQFAEYFVYFYAGYAFAPQIFKLVEWAQRNVALALGALAIYAAVNTVLVFTGGFEMRPVQVQMGYADLPGVRLILALAGSLALCVVAGLLSKLPFMGWLRWVGEHSIVIYLSFAIPMAVTRVFLLNFTPVQDVSTVSVIVWLVALIAPLVLYWLIQKTGWGKFLFERPAWAHLPGTPGSRGPTPKAVTAA